eukprot:TRINITY_DN27350_c0_g1_i1.p1 TRINITY_DN27350_c0_g1~~TRINITY_DN27350_c0_g1_i1.p1  ORF type:complete len:157 (-),score=26.04 TRINITY_DN27350_c0_g1_i1:191-661(-)
MNETLSEIILVAQSLNEVKGRAETLAKLTAVQSKLIGLPFKLMDPDRQLLMEGTLVKIGKQKKRYVYLLLMSDVIILTIQRRRNLMYKSSIFVKCIKAVRSSSSEDDSRNSCYPFSIDFFDIHSPSLRLRVETEISRIQWMNALNQALQITRGKVF